MKYLLILAMQLFLPDLIVPPACSDTLQLERVKLDGIGSMMTGGGGEQQSLTLTKVDFDKKDTIRLSAIIYRNNAVYKMLDGYSYADFLDNNNLFALDLDGKPWRYHLSTQQREKFITDLPLDGLSGADFNVRKWKGKPGLMIRTDSAILFQGAEESQSKKILQLEQFQQLNKAFAGIVSFDIYEDKMLTILRNADENEETRNFEVCYFDGSKAVSLYRFTSLGDGDVLPAVRFAGPDQYFLSFNDSWGRIQLNDIREKKAGPLFCIDSAIIKNITYRNNQLYCEMMKTMTPQAIASMQDYIKLTFSRLNVYKVLNKFDIKQGQ
ncbi:hypothetical protein CLV59_101760 [Chitinophaga dinghuensis]|uniref:Uncharacterized protein n=1 Tax=Chitinophaga dinghuensis TaxID=1539050 RepID=A0A327WBU9_9BACT|nr:hypothetical protein [Chitinophaga dinghuensis]RAJ87995.1 hypothetical protein CLV59_101760 [Chitinophaga dinghuensis]